MRTVVEIIGRFDSLSNGSKSFEKAIDIKRKKKFSRTARFFIHSLATSLRGDHNLNFHYATF